MVQIKLDSEDRDRNGNHEGCMKGVELKDPEMSTDRPNSPADTHTVGALLLIEQKKT